MTPDECQATFGLEPKPADLPEIRRLLAAETAREAARQGDGDTELMRLLCVQLWMAGHVEDAPAVWRAKRASFDAGCSIDGQLLCAAGPAATEAFFAAHGPAEALAYVREELEPFDPAAERENYARYYADGEA